VNGFPKLAGGHDSRIITFYSQVPEVTGFVEKVVVPLLSMRAIGTISVERAAKPLKNYVRSKSRNRNGMEKSETLASACRSEHLALAPDKQGSEEDNEAHSP